MDSSILEKINFVYVFQLIGIVLAIPAVIYFCFLLAFDLEVIGNDWSAYSAFAFTVYLTAIASYAGSRFLAVVVQNLSFGLYVSKLEKRKNKFLKRVNPRDQLSIQNYEIKTMKMAETAFRSFNSSQVHLLTTSGFFLLIFCWVFSGLSSLLGVTFGLVLGYLFLFAVIGIGKIKSLLLESIGMLASTDRERRRELSDILEASTIDENLSKSKRYGRYRDIILESLRAIRSVPSVSGFAVVFLILPLVMFCVAVGIGRAAKVAHFEPVSIETEYFKLCLPIILRTSEGLVLFSAEEDRWTFISYNEIRHIVSAPEYCP